MGSKIKLLSVESMVMIALINAKVYLPPLSGYKISILSLGRSINNMDNLRRLRPLFSPIGRFQVFQHRINYSKLQHDSRMK